MADMNKIADKIQKLLSLAGNNPSAEEAQEALLKAQKLMAQYNITMEASEAFEEFQYALIRTTAKQHQWNNNLATIIANSFACRAIIQSDKHLAFFGRSDNAQAAASAMEFAAKAMSRGGNRATREAGIEPGHKGAANIYNSYAIGFLQGLKRAMDAQTKALAVVVPEDVKTEFNKQFPKLGKLRRSKTATPMGASAYNAGLRDGENCMNKRSLEA